LYYWYWSCLKQGNYFVEGLGVFEARKLLFGGLEVLENKLCGVLERFGNRLWVVLALDVFETGRLFCGVVVLEVFGRKLCRRLEKRLLEGCCSSSMSEFRAD